jgi:hypothetical protein
MKMNNVTEITMDDLETQLNRYNDIGKKIMIEFRTNDFGLKTKVVTDYFTELKGKPINEVDDELKQMDFGKLMLLETTDGKTLLDVMEFEDGEKVDKIMIRRFEPKFMDWGEDKVIGDWVTVR